MPSLGASDLNVFPLALGTNRFDTADTYSYWVAGNSGGESDAILGNWFAARGSERSPTHTCARCPSRRGGRGRRSPCWSDVRPHPRRGSTVQRGVGALMSGRALGGPSRPSRGVTGNRVRARPSSHRARLARRPPAAAGRARASRARRRAMVPAGSVDSAQGSPVSSTNTRTCSINCARSRMGFIGGRVGDGPSRRSRRSPPLADPG